MKPSQIIRKTVKRLLFLKDCVLELVGDYQEEPRELQVLAGTTLSAKVTRVTDFRIDFEYQGYSVYSLNREFLEIKG